jgi:GDPmannose 4,6-dehydratase
MTSRALICGISGQDGAYLAKLLLDKGYEVFGTSRDAQQNSFSNLSQLKIQDRIQIHSMALNDFRSVLQTLSSLNPSEVYNLAGQSSVGLSFDQPMETFESIVIGTLNILESIRFLGRNIRFYNAASSEAFGNTGETPADEGTAFRPCSPYGVAKAAAFMQVANYRDAYNLFACSGILFNHESPLRPPRFVTRKVTSAVSRISKGSNERLRLGRLDIIRDWGWAPEYVHAMWLMLQQTEAQDYVIATGVSSSLREFVDISFKQVGLNWEDYVDTDTAFSRPSDPLTIRASPKRANKILGWTAQTNLHELITRMIAVDMLETK